MRIEFNGLGMNLGSLSRLSRPKSRSIRAENFTGEKDRPGMDPLEPHAPFPALPDANCLEAI
jgi:hypothetical protein